MSMFVLDAGGANVWECLFLYISASQNVALNECYWPQWKNKDLISILHIFFWVFQSNGKLNTTHSKNKNPTQNQKEIFKINVPN